MFLSQNWKLYAKVCLDQKVYFSDKLIYQWIVLYESKSGSDIDKDPDSDDPALMHRGTFLIEVPNPGGTHFKNPDPQHFQVTQYHGFSNICVQVQWSHFC